MRKTQGLFGRLMYGAVAVTAIAIGSTNLFASPIPLGGGGVINVSNVTGEVVAVSSNTPCISFAGNAPACNGLNTAVIVSGTDPIFGTTGTIDDIATTFPILDFKTANLTVGGGPAHWDLLNIIAPVGFAACATNTNSGSCSTGIFVLTQASANQVSISFSTNERGYLGNTGTGFTPYIGVFTTQISGDLTAFGCTGPNCADTIGNVLLWQAGAGHTISSTWSATESPVSGIPEPVSFVLFGSGLLAVSLLGRRYRRS